jgi:hypothetical protein
MTRRNAVLFSILLSALMVGGSASGDPAGKDDYLADCAHCHGVDGKGGVGEMRAVRGYISVDLTQLSKKNNGQFPHQEVYDAIDGRKRFPVPPQNLIRMDSLVVRMDCR